MSNIWDEFFNKKVNLCSLCGNWGVIDSRGIKSPAGVACGRLNYCICPNGRRMKKRRWDIEKEIAGMPFDRFEACPVREPYFIVDKKS